jgi:dihydrofolate synthase/folylpolyglutamate synthase
VSFRSLQSALEWLETHVDFERVTPTRQSAPSLQPIIETLKFLGSPETDYPCVHVTGTNGKGTTTTLISALLGACGLRVGTFTSPDLHSVNERIAVAGAPVDDESFTLLLSRMAGVEEASGIVLTRFEILTVAAFLHFSDEGVDVAAIEVGLGGTWDSTNVIDGVVNVLTNVDLDHVAVLGATISEIASDKVGIFREAAPSLLATEDPIVVEIARRKTEELNAPLFLIGEEFALIRNDVALGGRLISLRTPFAHYEDVGLSLHGIHQGTNAATAVVASELFLGRALGERVVRETLSHATMPGRLELLSRRPTMIVDGAHNPAGMRALARALNGAFHVEGERRCVLGMLTGRDVDDMVAPLIEAGVAEFFCCAPRSPRAMEASIVADAVRRAGAVAYEYASVESALAHAREYSQEQDLIVVAGSLYVVGEVRSRILGLSYHH